MPHAVHATKHTDETETESDTTRESNITPKRTFDRAYFDRWYRHPVCRVKSGAELEREVEFVLGATEYLLGRPVRSVLDVGCGEGNWYPPLTARRPRLHYTGVDPSEYAVRRWGKRRNIHHGSVDHIGVDGQFDLVVCCGVLNYLAADTLTKGLAEIAERVGGVARTWICIPRATRSRAIPRGRRSGEPHRGTENAFTARDSRRAGCTCTWAQLWLTSSRRWSAFRANDGGTPREDNAQ